MLHRRQSLRGVVIVVFTSILSGPASADVIVFQSSLMGAPAFGGYSLSSNQYLGARFHISAPTQIIAVGGNIGGGWFHSDGSTSGATVFGSIVPLSGPTALPSNTTFETDVLGVTVFTTPNGFHDPSADLRAPLALTLQPGWYGLVFGAGAFGTPALPNSGNMPSDNTPIAGNESYFAYQPITGTGQLAWVQFPTSGLRFVVVGIPEPSPLALASIAVGVFALASLWRSKRAALVHSAEGPRAPVLSLVREARS